MKLFIELEEDIEFRWVYSAYSLAVIVGIVLYYYMS